MNGKRRIHMLLNNDTTYKITAVTGIGDRQWSFNIIESAKNVDELVTKLQTSDGILRQDGGEWNVIGARIIKIKVI